MNPRALCFVAMPFGKKTDLGSGVEVDFDHIYDTAIRPAIEDAGLEPLRADEERSGGIIHAPMFERLLLAEYVVVDLTLANANVFYELGIRHAARPFTTVPIFAALQPLPFDVAPMRALGYALEKGALTEAGASALREGIAERLKHAIHGETTQDSPIFRLIPGFPGIDLPHEATESFQRRIRMEEGVRDALALAAAQPAEERTAALRAVEQDLGPIKTMPATLQIDLLLAYRDATAWDEMVRLCEGLPDHVQRNVMVRQQWALALNRRNGPADRNKALAILKKLEEEQGADPETLGILGRIHKDRYREAKQAGSPMAAGALDEAIQAYARGFESDPRDYYPGVNAVTLLVEKGDSDAMAKARRLVPVVRFAVERRGGDSSSDYWDLATVVELACVDRDWATASAVLPRALAATSLAWNLETTRDNLVLLRDALEKQGDRPEPLGDLIASLEARAKELQAAGA
jgi:tetratricopeptide (TPR) repeat protein